MLTQEGLEGRRPDPVPKELGVYRVEGSIGHEITFAGTSEENLDHVVEEDIDEDEFGVVCLCALLCNTELHSSFKKETGKETWYKQLY